MGAFFWYSRNYVIFIFVLLVRLQRQHAGEGLPAGLARPAPARRASWRPRLLTRVLSRGNSKLRKA